MSSWARPQKHLTAGIANVNEFPHGSQHEDAISTCTSGEVKLDHAIYARIYTRVASHRSVLVNVRLKPREIRAWRSAAVRSDVTLAEWIRRACEKQLNASAD